MRTTRMIRLIPLAALVVLSSACVSKKKYDTEVAQAAALAAEKDSLLSEVVATSQFIAAANQEIDKVRTGQPVASRTNEMETLSPAQAREQLLTRVQELTARVREAEQRVASSRNRIASLTAGNAAQTAKFDSTITQYQTLIENQKAEIVSLLDQVATLTAQNAQLREQNATLATERASLAASNDLLTTEKNTVYYVAGTKADLIRRGVIQQRGGLLGIGRTLVLNRSLDAGEFTAANRVDLATIALPDSNKSYRMVSPNDVAGLDGAPSDGKFKGEIRIGAPEIFWRTSRFLVLVEN